jgi:hypothetical protein
MFSQRHYVFLANFIAYERAVSSGESWDKDQVRTKTVEGIARLLARRLADDNPKFDRERFLAACEVEDTQPEQHSEATYANQLWHARRLLREEGRESLRHHAGVGGDCRCGSCFCCAAAEVLGKTISDNEPSEVQ